jgi:hypothetical protein
VDRRVPFAPQPGDFDSDGTLNLNDITLLFQQLQSPNPSEGFDLNGDGLLNEDDRDVLVLDLMGTTYGDANLNRVFDSNDLIDALAAGQYNDGITGNSTWDTGDWNGDGEFDSDDLLLAAQWGGYEGAPIAPRATQVAALAMAAIQADELATQLDDELLETLANEL